MATGRRWAMKIAVSGFPFALSLLLRPTTNQWHITILRDDRRWRQRIIWTSGIIVTWIFEIVKATKLTTHLTVVHCGQQAS
jgi:hypothetical protein